MDQLYGTLELREG
jgi:hypothetical protein